MDDKSIYRQVYNTRNDEHILSGTENVICAITRRGIVAAGFNKLNELLAIHYVGYQTDRPVWELDFFEPLFAQEPLLVKHNKISKVFICTERSMIIPEELYTQQAAEEWFRNIHYTEKNDTILSYPIKAEHAQYIYAVPVYIRELISINCPKAAVMPLPLYQLTPYDGNKEPLQCFITAEQASVTWYKNNKLFWHKVFDYSNAEEIAYNIKLVCEEHNINAAKLTIAVNTMSATEYPVANELSKYFNSITTGSGKSIHAVWHPVLSLIQQLSACV